MWRHRSAPWASWHAGACRVIPPAFMNCGLMTPHGSYRDRAIARHRVGRDLAEVFRSTNNAARQKPPPGFCPVGFLYHTERRHSPRPALHRKSCADVRDQSSGLDGHSCAPSAIGALGYSETALLGRAAASRLRFHDNASTGSSLRPAPRTIQFPNG